jgi:hypothetical protein
LRSCDECKLKKRSHFYFKLITRHTEKKRATRGINCESHTTRIIDVNFVSLSYKYLYKGKDRRDRHLLLCKVRHTIEEKKEYHFHSYATQINEWYILHFTTQKHSRPINLLLSCWHDERKWNTQKSSCLLLRFTDFLLFDLISANYIVPKPLMINS